MPKHKGKHTKRPKARNGADGRMEVRSKKEQVGQKLSEQDLVKRVELIKIEQLQPHPRNYRDHPEDQINHVEESIKENGFYRNVVIARDNVILAGHGVVKAAQKMGLKEIPVIRLNIDSDDKRAIKILIGDNEIARLAMPDDRALTEMLKELSQWDASSLLGTGFDTSMLAALTYVTRPAAEIKNLDEAAHWIGMPEFERQPLAL